MRASSVLVALAALLALAAVAEAATVYAKKTSVDCDSKGACRVQLGKAGAVSLPALVAFKSAHDQYLSVTPPNGGTIWLSGHPKAWEEWEMVKVGNKIALKSHHTTYLSQHFSPADGYAMTSERLDHELFIVEEKGGQISLKGHNGMYVSAHADPGLGLKQEMEVGEWEKWTIEYTRQGHVALRSAHGTYLGASNPTTYGVVTQQPDLNTWETFVIDHVDKERITIETSHNTYIAAHADEYHPDKVVTMDRASMWELWKPHVNTTSGGVCLQAHDGRFLAAYEDVFEGWGLAPHCMEHELLQVILVDDKMLAAAAKAAAAKRAAA
eukprot:CAMPEP_0206245924 /NCGR_PEP_ID=MMETSP0047_2-20121206/18967_1 /ASSEMBLY_ACC=CAM_ASM_000192 /TAXON_ID=195065 /ORGANISM="Chroomonas mesostigmatica_cf, Strain CCMP1168" /LENGTH=324 /DNA_ID=CAMNT_0053671277 /DNA_START=113 /DNA_END=1087 /DNA_ORIENTATION=-